MLRSCKECGGSLPPGLYGLARRAAVISLSCRKAALASKLAWIGASKLSRLVGLVALNHFRLRAS